MFIGIGIGVTAGGLSPLQMVLNSAALYLPLIGTLAAATGTNPTYSRASVATMTDFEGNVVTVPSGCVRFPGWRFERNLWNGASSTLASGASNTMTLSAGTYVFSMGAGTGTATFSGTGGATGTLTADATKRKQVAKTITAGTLVVTASVATLVDLMVNYVTGRAKQDSPEYISIGVTSAPLYHGAGADGCKYFSYQNGNTVDVNGVVTEAQGAAISAATLQGALLEPARTNLCLWSNDLTNAAWLPGTSGAAAPTKTVESTIKAPNGANCTKLVYPAVAAGQFSFTYQYLSAQSGGIWLRGNSGGEVIYLFRQLGGGSFTKTTCTLTTSWQYFKLECATSGLFNWCLGFDLRDATQAATSGVAIYAACCNIENAVSASSYIETTTAALTRAADSLTEPTAGNITAAAGTVSLDVVPANTSTSRVMRVYVDASNYIALDVVGGGTVTATKVVAGVTVTQSLGTATVGATAKLALSWGAAGFILSVNGASATNASTTTLASLPANVEYSASSNVFTMNNHRAWPTQLPAATLQALTA